MFNIFSYLRFCDKLEKMKKDFKKPSRAGREIEWLIRDKYNGVCNTKCCTDDIERLKQGEPIDYVIGWKEFLGCKVDLSEKPLIPREETEFWVGESINGLEAKPPSKKDAQLGGLASKSLKALDLFAGSGCIGLAVLKHCPNVQVTFADKEEKCVKQIKKNLSLLFPPDLKGARGVAGGARVVLADVFSLASRGQSLRGRPKDCPREAQLGKFDIIFANPPYIPIKKSKVQKSVKDWEPREALFSGTDGLVIIKKFLKEAKNHLNHPSTLLGTSKIYLEFGYGQKKAIEALLKQNKYKNWEFRKDQFGRFRLVVIQ